MGIASAVAAAALGFAMSASAATVTVLDTYHGGNNTYNSGPGGDVIGSSTFDTTSASFTRTNGGGTLVVTINTNYAFAPGTGPAEGTGYGALFLTPGYNAWTPTGVGPAYDTDVYQAGDWAYALTVPFNPSTTSGSAALYAVQEGSVVMSNVNNNPITYPYVGHGGYYFRAGQAVQYTPGQSAISLASGSWAVDPGKLTFTIDDGGLLGDNMAFSWAMTCGNDVIQGNVTGIPEPATWALLIGGFGMTGVALRRRRDATAAA